MENFHFQHTIESPALIIYLQGYTEYIQMLDSVWDVNQFSIVLFAFSAKYWKKYYVYIIVFFI